MPEKWSKKFNKCQNCGTTRFPHQVRGYCRRCYPLVLRLEKVEHWDLKNGETLIGYPQDSSLRSEKYFKKIKQGFAEQIKGRLSDLKFYEQGRNIKVYGSNIVPLFRNIAKKAGSKNKDFLWHHEDLFDHNFHPKQKNIIYKILLDIEESIPWTGINWNKIFFRE